MKEIALVAGAGPAGLTAALELLRRSDVLPVVFEADSLIGGISKTINYRGNRMDLGGHRFFSKSDWVMRWWQDMLPIAGAQASEKLPLRINHQGQSRMVSGDLPGTSSSDAVMLIRERLSRIFYRGRFFDYPLALNATTLRNLGLVEALHIGLSYGQSRMKRRVPETSLEEFFVNRFGDRLYRTFFKDYTEKVWGVPCTEISAEWGAQRVKGLSIGRAIQHALTSAFRNSRDQGQKNIETSLIERFLYPKLGPGQLWEEAAQRIVRQGGEIHLKHRVIGIERSCDKIIGATVLDQETGLARRVHCDHFISTIPVTDLVRFLAPVDEQTAAIAEQLPYRDFMTAGLLLRRMRHGASSGREPQGNGMPPDNWIYIQEPGVKLGRVQIFNNWSPSLVADPATIWLGLEYFCSVNDDLWAMDDSRFVDYAAAELEKIGLIHRRDVIDGTLVRVPKAYPAYFGSYNQFGRIRDYLDSFANLYAIGRNGMHRYNNQDHSMLAANSAVNSILNGGNNKSEIWRVNAEDDYHEEIMKPEQPRTVRGLAS